MSKKKDIRVELRYYAVPQNEYSLGLLGDSWNRVYHNDILDLHFHNLLEIGFCHSGDGSMVFDDGVIIPYSSGTFTVIPQNMPHSTWSSGSDPNYWEFLFVDVENFVSGTYISDPIFAHELNARIKKRYFVQTETDQPALAGTIKAILLEKKESMEFGAEIEKCLVQKLLLQIARSNPFEGKKGDHPLKRRKMMLESLDYVNEHYAEPIKIHALAKTCHMSETHFRRMFEDTIHMMPVDYINYVRIQKSCELLHSANDTIENVAAKVGFISQSTFNRNFLRFVGVSPHKWKTAADNYEVKLQNYKITALKGW